MALVGKGDVKEEGTEKRRKQWGPGLRIQFIPPPPGRTAGRKCKDGRWQGQFHLFQPTGRGIMYYDTGDRYEGTMSYGKRESETKGNFLKGTYFFANGSKYQGQHSKDMFHGKGKYWFPDGSSFEETWQKDTTVISNHEFKNGSVYSGSVRKGRLEGEGVLLFPDGDEYRGVWQRDHFHGKGVYRSRSGDWYEGTFAEGGKDKLGSRGEKGAGKGLASLTDGDVYYGSFNAGVPDGKGNVLFADGGMLEATFEHGKCVGRRTFANGDVYEGEFRMNEPHGEGSFTFRDGTVCTTTFDSASFSFERRNGKVLESGVHRNGILHGPGCRVTEKESYSGEFYQSLYYGRGTLEVAERNLKYEGEFVAGKFGGYGKLLYGLHPPGLDPESEEAKCYGVSAKLPGCGVLPEGCEYEGEFVHGMRQGKGEFRSKEESYVGEFDEDMYHGKGLWTCHTDSTAWSAGSSYEGEWVCGRRDGMGKYVSDVGYTYEGSWMRGLKHGEGLERTVPPGGSGIYSGEFFLDLRHGKGAMRYDYGGIYEGEWKLGRREGKGTEVFISGGKYEGEYYNDLMNGSGCYTVPPVTVEEQRRAYRLQMLARGEQVLKMTDRLIDEAEVLRAKSFLSMAEMYFSSAGYIDPPPPQLVHQLGRTLDGGFAGCTSPLLRATDPESRAKDMGLLRERLSHAVGEVLEGEKTNMQRGSQHETSAAFIANLESILKDLESPGQPSEAAEELPDPDKSDGKELEWKDIDNGTYEGEFVDGQRHGHGLRRYGNGDVYVGSWQGGKKSGRGLMRYMDGSEYDGFFWEGCYHGEGRWRSGKGYSYRGSWMNGKKEGEGAYWWSEEGAAKEDYYAGRFHEDKPHGAGRRIFASGASYVGEFKEGFFDGQGVMRYADGARYEGRWRRDKRHGRGVWEAVNGEKFRGEWEEDVAMDGWGVMEDKATRSVYTGEVRSRRRHGVGSLAYKDKPETYEGEWREGRRHGRGRSEHADATGGWGSRFEGEWEQDRAISGEGKLVYSKSSWYSGEIQRGARQGKGTMLYEEGDVYHGDWKTNLRHGHGCMIRGRVTYEGPWVYDDAGEEEEPEWRPYEESNPAVLLLYARREWEGMCSLLAFPRGRCELFAKFAGKEEVMEVCSGPARQMADEMVRLGHLEREVEESDMANKEEELARIRSAGSSRLAAANSFLTAVVWDILPQDTKLALSSSLACRQTVQHILAVLQFSSFPSVVSWYSPRKTGMGKCCSSCSSDGGGGEGGGGSRNPQLSSLPSVVSWFMLPVKQSLEAAVEEQEQEREREREQEQEQEQEQDLKRLLEGYTELAQGMYEMTRGEKRNLSMFGCPVEVDCLLWCSWGEQEKVKTLQVLKACLRRRLWMKMPSVTTWMRFALPATMRMRGGALGVSDSDWEVSELWFGDSSADVKL